MTAQTKKMLMVGGVVALLFIATSGSEAATESADLDYRGQSNLPRGMRNNNPGNLKYFGIGWQGEVGSDGTFSIFQSYKWGIRAMMKQLFKYFSEGRDTIQSIIAKWAPAGADNNPEAVYADYVAGYVGVSKTARLAPDYNTIANLVIAMSWFENGRQAVTPGQTKAVWKEFFNGGIGKVVKAKPPGVTPCRDGMFSTNRGGGIGAIPDEIVYDILRKTPLKHFNYAIENYNLKSLYDRHKNYLLRTYFNGNALSYSTTMAKIFSHFQTTNDEGRARQIASELHFLKTEIVRKKKYKIPHGDLVKKYNQLADELNALNQPVEKLIQMYKTVKS